MFCKYPGLDNKVQKNFLLLSYKSVYKQLNRIFDYKK